MTTLELRFTNLTISSTFNKTFPVFNWERNWEIDTTKNKTVAKMLQLHLPKITLNFKAKIKMNDYIIFHMLLLQGEQSQNFQ